VGELRELQAARLGDHLDRLFRAAWAMCGSREDAEDLVQETYARVLAKPRFLRGNDDLGYLLRVLRNTHVSRLRAASRRPVLTEEVAEPEDLRSAWRPEEHLDVEALFAAVADLPPNFRDALVAVDIAGLTYGEAGRALDVKEATITTRLHRARLQVAAALAPAGKREASEGVLQDERA
jgi:RNA polymerase sigma-70 factor (ECF subfamily)